MAGHPLQPKSWASVALNDHRLQRIRRYIDGRTVLDLGCATGVNKAVYLHDELGKVAARVVGLDIDAEKVAMANERWGTTIRAGDASSSISARPSTSSMRES